MTKTDRILAEFVAIIRRGRQDGETAVPIILCLCLPDPERRVLAIMRDLGGLTEEERIAAGHARGEIGQILRLESVETALPILCRHLTPDLRDALSQKLPADGCWFLIHSAGQVSLSGDSTEDHSICYVPERKFELAAPAGPGGAA